MFSYSNSTWKLIKHMNLLEKVRPSKLNTCHNSEIPPLLLSTFYFMENSARNKIGLYNLWEQKVLGKVLHSPLFLPWLNRSSVAYNKVAALAAVHSRAPWSKCTTFSIWETSSKRWQPVKLELIFVIFFFFKLCSPLTKELVGKKRIVLFTKLLVYY